MVGAVEQPMIRALLRLLLPWLRPPTDARSEWAFDPSCDCDACEAARDDYLKRHA